MAKAKIIKTYNCKEVIMVVGPHMISGYAEDSFVTLEPNGEGITKVVGCDGEVARALDPDDTYKVRISLLQTSDSNEYLQSLLDYDLSTGNGIVPLIIKDLRGGTILQAEQAWIVRAPGRVYGRANQNREWELDTGGATFIGG